MNLPQLNLAVLRQTLISKHQELLLSIEQLNDLKILKLMAQRIRNTFAFLKNGLLVVAAEDLIGASDNADAIKDAWEEFVSTYQDKICSGDTDAVIVIGSPGKRPQQLARIKRIEMIILDGTRIARMAWGDEESEPQWSDDGVDGAAPESRDKLLDKKLILIHRILNGEKQKVSKAKPAPLFSFGAKPVQKKDEDPKEDQPAAEVEAPQWCKDTMVTAQPLSAVLAFYRYYLLQPKYKAIVKHDLDHPAYFKKRDRILELISQEKHRTYFTAANLSFLSL